MLEYIIQFIPTIVALIAECGIVKYALDVLKKAKNTSEMKAVIDQNKILVQELREAKKLNKELLTKIDRISRGEE